ncbi:isochorismate synthase [Actinoallomurus spadix]|uniref:isochorismate synthase n=1 Tax=Actinoallomurus spadix TaxID=79912 RepID=A0ABP3GX75_9ACTN|nr:isochorismate synthase [Actinoallomurus spadix]MCO5986025.1 isochorismate synthase [Actinoallomurus spadix]
MIGVSPEFVAACERARAAAERSGRPVIVSWGTPVPAASGPALLASASRGTYPAFVWESAWTGRSIYASGSALNLVGWGPNRFAAISHTWRQQARAAITVAAAQPCLVGRFSFFSSSTGAASDRPDGLMWLPAAQVTLRDGGEPVLTLNAWITPDAIPEQAARPAAWHARRLLEPAPRVSEAEIAATILFEQPSPEGWRDLVDEAVTAMAAAEFEKVVLARQTLVLTHSRDPAAELLARLARSTAGGTLIGVGRDGEWLVAATPECLVRLTDGQVHTHSLAGTVPRDLDSGHDATLTARLQSDPKLSREQAIVTSFITNALRAACDDIRADAARQVVRLATVQHLETSIQATVRDRDETSVLDLAGLLHPTPAVGGYPRDAALRWIERREPGHRGWYAAPVGWTDLSGDGEMAVAIRSASITGNRATVYAGAGLVAGSRAAEEYEETRWKMRPMLAALGVPDMDRAGATVPTLEVR